MARTAKPAHSSFAQTKETLGSIIFALIIALVFRGFVGQAFVIPTGSMAPTLYGDHMNRVCPACGYHYAVGLDRPDQVPSLVQCPNCNQPERLTSRPIPDAGDGIFTLSWPFAVGGPFSAQRWDVVVFKAPFRIQLPAAQRDSRTSLTMQLISPERDGETNYIKRLIGLPGDIIEIIDGDIYTCRGEDVPEATRARLLHGPLPEPLSLEQKKDLDAKLTIARKTAQAQQALWQVLFDADFLPARSPAAAAIGPAWKPVPGATGTSGWTCDGRLFRFDNTMAAPAGQPAATGDQPPAGPGEPQFLELTGKDFRDNYGYNCGGGMNIVSDLRLAAAVNWQGGDGALQLCLSKRDDLYTVEIRPRQGTGRTLLASRGDPTRRQEIQGWTFPAWKRNQPVRVSFANVDHRLEVRVNDRLAWQHDLPISAAQAKQQLRETIPPIVRIGATGLKAELAHLQVSRDVYYQDNAPIITVEGLTRRVFNEYSDKPGWATRDNPMLLRADEYYVLGDNSPASLDSRRWWQTGAHLAGRPEGYRPGTVPADQMIGKAYFVYWPSWYRLWDIPVLRVIPNIGEMRWIQ